MGIMTSDDYYSGSVSAAFGGNTTFIPFAAQHRGQNLGDVIKLYHDRAGPKSVIDYSFHLILATCRERWDEHLGWKVDWPADPDTWASEVVPMTAEEAEAAQKKAQELAAQKKAEELAQDDYAF